MHLTRYSDYAMRVLLYLAAKPDRLCSIAEVSVAYGISQSHLMRVVNDLGQAGYVATVRGGTGVLGEAMAAFIAVLDRYTLADVIERRHDVLRLLLAPAA